MGIALANNNTTFATSGQDSHMPKLFTICISVLILIIPTMEWVTAMPQNNSTVNQPDGLQIIESWISNNTNTVLEGIAGTLITIILTPIMKEWFDMRKAYFKPYTKWCVSFSGILHEFEEICSKIKDEKIPNHAEIPEFEPTDILSHLWQMHQETENGVKWIGMIKKDYEKAGESLDEIFDGVDRIWHKLENKYYNFLLEDSTTPKDFKKILKDMKKRCQLVEEIAEDIEYEIKKSDKFRQDNFRHIRIYLNKKTPRELNPQQRLFFFIKNKYYRIKDRNRQKICCKECNEMHLKGKLYHTKQDIWEKYNGTMNLDSFKKLIRKD